MDRQASEWEFEVLPALRQLYEMGDGLTFAAYPAMVLSMFDAVGFTDSPIEYSAYLPWPFLEVRGSSSDPICVIVKGPATGYVMQRNHDAEDRMLAPSLETFFDWMAAGPPEDFFRFDGPSPLFTGNLSDLERATVEQMMEAAATADDSYEGESLYDLVSSMVDDATYAEIFSREVVPIRNYYSCVLRRARVMAPELAASLQEMYNI